MAYTKTNWENNVTPINDDNLNKIEEGIYENSLKIDEMGDGVIKLLSITEEPTTFQEKDKYYNSDDDLIYEAVDSSTWDNGTTPRDTAIYLNLEDNKLYRYYNNSMNLLAGTEIPIQDTPPANPEEDDLWIDTSEPEEMQEAIVNEYSESTSNTYSCDYVNKEISGLDNGHVNGNDGYGGLVKRTIRANQTIYTFNVPNNQSGGFIRSAIVTCGNKGIMFVCWTGNNAPSVPPTIVWKSFNDNVTFNHNNGVLTFTFDSTLYGSVSVLFMN